MKARIQHVLDARHDVIGESGKLVGSDKGGQSVMALAAKEVHSGVAHDLGRAGLLWWCIGGRRQLQLTSDGEHLPEGLHGEGLDEHSSALELERIDHVPLACDEQWRGQLRGHCGLACVQVRHLPSRHPPVFGDDGPGMCKELWSPPASYSHRKRPGAFGDGARPHTYARTHTPHMKSSGQDW